MSRGPNSSTCVLVVDRHRLVISLSSFLQFFFTDHFLNYEFLRYIYNPPCITHVSAPQLCKKSVGRGSNTSGQSVSKAGKMLPLQVPFIQPHVPNISCKCNLRYGGSGTLQNYDAICLLPLNILNEKL